MLRSTGAPPSHKQSHGASSGGMGCYPHYEPRRWPVEPPLQEPPSEWTAARAPTCQMMRSQCCLPPVSLVAAAVLLLFPLLRRVNCRTHPPPKKNTFDHYRNFKDTVATAAGFKDTMATGFKDTMATGYLQAAVLQAFPGMIEHARLPHHFKSDRVFFHNPAHGMEGFGMSTS
jgi:hypothetical protein